MANQYRSVLASGGASTGGDAVASEVLSGKTFTNDNGLQTGSMPNRGAVSGIATPTTPYTIPEGYHNGSGFVTAAQTNPLNGKKIHRDGSFNTSLSAITSGETLSMGAFNSGSFVLAYVTGLSGSVTISNQAAEIFSIMNNGTKTKLNTSGETTVNFSNIDMIFIQGNTVSSTTYNCSITLS